MYLEALALEDRITISCCHFSSPLSLFLLDCIRMSQKNNEESNIHINNNNTTNPRRSVFCIHSASSLVWQMAIRSLTRRPRYMPRKLASLRRLLAFWQANGMTLSTGRSTRYQAWNKINNLTNGSSGFRLVRH